MHRSLITPGVPPPPDWDQMPLIDDYIDVVDRFQDSISEVVRTIATAPDGGVLIHCAIGKDRTGITCGMLLDLVGVERETIGIDYAMSDECLVSERLDFLENGPGERDEREQFIARTTPHPEVMVGVLEHLDRLHGGTANYLFAGGMAEQDLERLAQRLLD